MSSTRFELFQVAHHARGFELEDVDGLATAEGLEGACVVEGDVAELHRGGLTGADEAECLGDNGQIAQPEDIHFEQADFGQRGAFVGGHQGVFVFGGALQGHNRIERIARDHDATGVGAHVAHPAFDFLGPVDDLLDLAARVVELAELGGLELFGLGEGVFEGQIRIGWDEFGDAVDLVEGDVEGAADVTDSGFGPKGTVGDDLGSVFAAVFVGDVIDDFAAARVGKIDVDVGHFEAFT